MKTRVMTTRACAALGVLVLTFAFAADVPANTRISDAARHGNPDALFSEGQKLARQGNKVVVRAEEDLLDGENMVGEGESLIDRGTIAVNRSRDDYARLNRNRGLASDPKDVEKEAKALRKIAKRWEEALDDLKKGEKLVKKGNRKISKARDRLREGTTLVETGNQMIRNSELQRMGEPVENPNG